MRAVELVPPDFSAVDDADGGTVEWINLRPAIDPDDDPGDVAAFALFRGRGPTVPVCTWHPGERMAGVLHAAGPKLAPRLDIPDGWRVVQDHPKRGLVLAVPLDVATEVVLAWLVETGTAVCPVPMTGTWVAELHP